MDVALKNTRDDIDFLTQRDTDKHLVRVLTSVVTIHQKRVGDYFTKWKKKSHVQTALINNDFARTMMRCYLNNLKSAFNRWKINRDYNILDEQQCTIQELTIKKDNLISNINSLDKSV